jgi:hypothetical protein
MYFPCTWQSNIVNKNIGKLLVACFQSKILNSKMTEGVRVPQGSVSGPETITSWSYSEEEEPITIEQPVTATIEEDQDSEVPSEE